MFTLLILFVVGLAVLVGISLVNGPFARRGGRTIIVERDAPQTIVEREVPRRRVVERVVEQPTVVEREYDA